MIGAWGQGLTEELFDKDTRSVSACRQQYDQTIRGIEEREAMSGGPATQEQPPWYRWISKYGNFRDNDCRDYYISLGYSKKRAKDTCNALKQMRKDAQKAGWAADKSTKHFKYETSPEKLQQDRAKAKSQLDFCKRQAGRHINRSPFSLFVAPAIGEMTPTKRAMPLYIWLLVGGSALSLAYALYKKKKG